MYRVFIVVQEIFRTGLFAIFIILLWLPLADRLIGFDAQPTTAEKRKLAPMPSFKAQWDALTEYPKGFEAYFNDNFGFRKSLIVLNNYVKVYGLGVSPTPRVMIGKDGWLFAGGRRIPLSARPFTAEQLVEWQKVLEDRRDWLAQRGIPYLFIMTPDKPTVYPEYLPGVVHRNRTLFRLDQLITHLKRNSDIAILDLRYALFDAKQEVRVFNRTDTHWNDWGAYTSYTAIIERLRGWFSELEPMPKTLFKVETRILPGGDLADALELRDHYREESIRLVNLSPPAAKRVRPGRIARRSSKRWPTRVTERDEPSLPRAVMFHNSFAFKFMPFLSEHFERILYSWQREFDTVLIDHERPDVVLQQTGERALLRSIPQNPEEVQDYRLRRDFESAPSTVWVINPENGVSGMIPEAQVEILSLPAQRPERLVLRSTGRSPSVLLPEIPSSPGSVLLLRIELESPSRTTLELEDSTRIGPGQAAAQPIRRNLRRGRNVLFFRLSYPVLTGRLRLRPGKAHGHFVIHSIEMRAAVSANEPPDPPTLRITEETGSEP